MSHRYASVERLRVENSLFTGAARMGILFTSPMPGGAVVRGNVLEQIGIRAIQLSGQVNMIRDGAVEHLPSAIVHDNQILGGGQQAGIHTAYIMGILVYGHNVSIQNNVIRDFNRGQPVPGEPYGHHLPDGRGGFHQSAWVEDDQANDARGRRLAGAAIYAKARTGLISGNICTNSGWRSVIEVKTGGLEPYVQISNNVVDGSSLCIDGSFGFESDSGRSVWSNNLIYNMPDTAIVVRSRRQNTFVNNVIHHARRGFSVPSEGAAEELLLNNHFVNVQEPIHGQGVMTAGVQWTAPPVLMVPSYRALPAPEAKHRGRLAIVLDQESDELVVCIQRQGRYVWQTVGASESKHVSVGALQSESWKPVGENLLLNPDFLLDTVQESGGPDPSWPAGWRVSVTGLPVASVLNYDTEMDEPGDRALRAFHHQSFNWLIEQAIAMEPGADYRIQAVVRASEVDTRTLLQVLLGENRVSEPVVYVHSNQWTTATLDLTVPEDGVSTAVVRLWSANRAGQVVWVDGLRVQRLVRKAESVER